MPIESFFFPKESLQGDEIPAHIIWKNIPFSIIKAEIPPYLKIKQLFNVTKNGWIRKPFGFIVKNIEIDGYLGMVFETRKLDTEVFDVWLDFTFLNEDQITERITQKIHLYRPKLVIEHVPSAIKVRVDKQIVSDKIKIRNVGEGTAIVSIESLEESEIQKKLPESIEEFRLNYFKDVKSNLSGIKERYSEHKQLMSRFLRILRAFLMKKQVEKKHYKKMERTLNDLIRVFETNEEFAREFVTAVGGAYLKNLSLMTVFKDFLDYYVSLASKRILISNPLWVVPISNEPKELDIEISITDLKIDEYPSITIPRITLVGNKVGEIPMYRLFEWG